ncbi:GIY-YIG nuclease family protein [Pseudomonas cannabina]|nr:GIY-YIG nuclease family protein [Pseudomonas cannabina]
MDREAIEHARALKRTLQTAIDSGEITSKESLLSRAAEYRLTVTRNGKDYAGFRCESGKRLRVHFNYGDHHPRKPKEPKPRRPPLSGTWIYALTAYSSDGDRKACYIGQSVNLRKRFKDHVACRRAGYSSSALIVWAAVQSVEIRVTVLSWVVGDQWVRTSFEGYWIRLAILAGFETPDVHRWGNLPASDNPVGQPDTWPSSDIVAASIPLALAAKEKLSLRPLFSNREAPPAETARQLDLNLICD